jgi:hypothetical protein
MRKQSTGRAVGHAAAIVNPTDAMPVIFSAQKDWRETPDPSSGAEIGDWRAARRGEFPAELRRGEYSL